MDRAQVGPRRKRVPGYLRHKASGQAIVVLGGRMHYLGAFNSPASKAKYQQLLADWLLNGRAGPKPREPAAELTVAQLADAYQAHADAYYRTPEGHPTGEANNIRYALQPLRAQFGSTAVAEFGPRALEAFRNALMGAALCRRFINHRVNIIRRAFKWAESKEMVPRGTFHALGTLEALKPGRTAARERAPVRAVEWERVEAVLPHLSRQTRSMVLLQWFTGARPGEVCAMRLADMDQSGEVWLYQPARHKTKHLGKARVVPLGPHAQSVFNEFLKGCPTDPIAFCFSPEDAERERWAQARKSRRTPLWPSHVEARARQKASRAPRSFGSRYTSTSYARAVARACDEAGIERWSPNMLRHAAATRLRKELGIEAARVVLGHSSSAVTEVYAELDARVALHAMRVHG